MTHKKLRFQVMSRNHYFDDNNPLGIDKEVVLERVKRDGMFIRGAAEELRNDREIVLAAVKQNVRSFEYTSKELRSDRSFVLASVKQNEYSFKYASEELRNDRSFVLDCVNTNGLSLEHVGNMFQYDREIVLASVKQNGGSFKYASEELRNDRSFVLDCVKINGVCLEHVGNTFKNDREIVVEAVKQNAISLVCASTDFRNDKELLLFSLSRCKGRNDIMNLVDDLLQSTLETSSILRLLNRHEIYGDVEKAYEEYKSRNVERDEYFEKLFEVKLREKGFMCSGKTISDREIFDGENTQIEKLLNLLSKIDSSQLDILRFLGRGAYGGTYLCRIHGVDGLFVVKFTNDIRNQQKREEVVERDSLYLPYHKNVVSILSHNKSVKLDLSILPDFEEYWSRRVSSQKVFVVGMILMKYHRMSLEKYFQLLLRGKEERDDSGFGLSSESLISQYELLLLRILEGVHHLHNNFIVHRDLHPGNIFVYPHEGRVWIGDFGCALDLRNNDNPKSKFLVHKNHEIMYCVTGSSVYFKEKGYSKCTAPEIVNFDPLKSEYLNYEKSDLYSVGVLVKFVMENCGTTDKLLGELQTCLAEDDPRRRLDFDLSIEKVREMVEMRRKQHIGSSKSRRRVKNTDQYDSDSSVMSDSDDYSD